MNNDYFGKLLNKAGNGNYKTPESVENVIRYITHTNKNPKPGLIVWNGIGIVKDMGVDSVIHQFELAQEMNTRSNSDVRYIDHEIFSFSETGVKLLAKGNVDLDDLAWELAFDFYDIDGCQVVYAIHAPNENGKNLHIHFAINTFDRYTSKKRRENTGDTKDRGARFQSIIASRVKEELTKETTAST